MDNLWKGILKIPGDFWEVVGEMSPYLLLGFGLAGVLFVLISPRVVERHLGGRGIWPVFKASLFGVPLPLCSCGVIPVSASLRRHGASKAATIAFLLSTPQTGVDSIAVTYGLLGPVFAIFRPIAALVTGFVGGGLVQILGEPNETDTANESATDTCTEVCCADRSARGVLSRVLRYGLVTLPRDIGAALLLCGDREPDWGVPGWRLRLGRERVARLANDLVALATERNQFTHERAGDIAANEPTREVALRGCETVAGLRR